MKTVAIAIAIAVAGCAPAPTCHERCLEWADTIDEDGFTARNYGFTVPRDELCTTGHDERFGAVEPGDCEACEAVLIEVEQMCFRRMCQSAACDRLCGLDDNGSCAP